MSGLYKNCISIYLSVQPSPEAGTVAVQNSLRTWTENTLEADKTEGKMKKKKTSFKPRHIYAVYTYQEYIFNKCSRQGTTVKKAQSTKLQFLSQSQIPSLWKGHGVEQRGPFTFLSHSTETCGWSQLFSQSFAQLCHMYLWSSLHPGNSAVKGFPTL